MNPESPTPREQLEAQVTALLLGELSADEAAALREVIAKDAQLSALHDRLKRTIELVRETAADPAELTVESPAPLRLGDERRQKLLAQFKIVKPKEFAKPRPSKSFQQVILELAAVIAILCVLYGMLLPATSASKNKAQKALVLNEQRLRALEQNKSAAASESSTTPLVTPPTIINGVIPAATGPEQAPPPTIVKNGNIVLPAVKEQFQSADAVRLTVQSGTEPGLTAGPLVPTLVHKYLFLDQLQPALQNKGGSTVTGTPQEFSAEQPPARLGESQTKLGDPTSPAFFFRDAAESKNTAQSPPAGTVATSDFRSTLDAPAQQVAMSGSIGGGAVQGEILTASGAANQNNRDAKEQAAAGTPHIVASVNSSLSSGGAGGGGRGGGGGGGGFGGGGGGGGRFNGGSTGFGINASDADAVSVSVSGGGGTVTRGRGGRANGVGRGNARTPTTPATAPVAAPALTADSFSNDGRLSSDGTDQMVLAQRAQTVQQNLLANSWDKSASSTSNESVPNQYAQPADISSSLNQLAAQDAGVNRSFFSPGQSGASGQSYPAQLGTVNATYDAETHSIIYMTDDRTAGSVSNLVTQIDAQQALVARQNSMAQLQATNGRLTTLTTEDNYLAVKVPVSEPQPEVLAVTNAFSTFSLNVSDVSFKLAAASLERGAMPDAGGVRTEEFINAFDYRDPAPAPGAPIGFAWERARYPFAHNRDLLRFSVKTAAAGRQAGRPLNIVLLLDNSGSMERADRVAIIKEALKVLAAQLQAQDKISVVTFARTARLWVDGIPGTQAAQVLDTVGSLTPEGGTDLADALDLAYATARRHYTPNGENRVVLLTDGAANLGNVDPAALKTKVDAQRKQGIDLDCFGIGWEGYNDNLLEELTRNGDGRYGFINTPEDAANGFAAQLAGALHVAASDVKVQVEFNPARVVSYRQLGYAKHQLTKEQFRDNTVQAAQIGAAEAGNALYTVELNPQGSGPVCTVRVRYRDPGTANYYEHAWDVPYAGGAVALDQANPAMRLAATASAFSEWLATSPFAGEVTPDALLGYLRGVPAVYGADTRPAQLETMIREAKSVTGK